MSKILALLALCAIPIFGYSSLPYLRTYRVVCWIQDHGYGVYFVDVKAPKKFNLFGFALLGRLNDGTKIVYPLSPFATTCVRQNSRKSYTVRLTSRQNGEKNGKRKMEKKF